MFNRTLEMKMVKKSKNEKPLLVEDDIRLDKIAVIGYQIERMFNKAGKAALAYVVLDTVRQVVLAKTNQP